MRFGLKKRKRPVSTGVKLLKRRRKPWTVKLPTFDVEDLVRWKSENVVEICLPLSPTKNVWNTMHPMAKMRYGKRVREYAWVLGRVAGIRRFWAQKVRIGIVRCSEASRRADIANIVSGVEKHLDAIVHAGFVEDDDPEHMELGEIREFVKGSWGSYLGPGTWIIIEKLK